MVTKNEPVAQTMIPKSERTMKELLKQLEELKASHELNRGSVKMGIASHWWDGRSQGIQDVIDLLKGIKKGQAITQPTLVSSHHGHTEAIT